MELQLERVAKRMEGRGIDLAFTPAVKKFIAEKGYDAHYGARPIKRAIQKEILDPMAQEIIGGKMPDGGRVLVDIKDDKAVFLKQIKKTATRERVSAILAKS